MRNEDVIQLAAIDETDFKAVCVAVAVTTDCEVGKQCIDNKV